MQPWKLSFSSRFLRRPPKSRSVNTISTVSEHFEKWKGSDSRKKSILGLKMAYKAYFWPILTHFGIKVTHFVSNFCRNFQNSHFWGCWPARVTFLKSWNTSQRSVEFQLYSVDFRGVQNRVTVRHQCDRRELNFHAFGPNSTKKWSLGLEKLVAKKISEKHWCLTEDRPVWGWTPRFSKNHK